ncbi:MAG: PEP-CTERM-box response regulator transcription factor [Pseudomonadales bacterium]|nr:PEP-CTERM-box response regulator transcription factor [Pseudomonadales bacterium]
MRWCYEDVDVAVADDAPTALGLLSERSFQVVTLDLGLPPDAGGTTVGFDLLRHIREHYPETKVIVITGRDEKQHALAAINNGAFDYYQKPIDSTTLTFATERAFFLSKIEAELQEQSKAATSNKSLLPGLIGNCPEMQTVSERVKRVAKADVTVLITGETGTGKEIIASSIHNLSDRGEHSLITINCAAIPENLLESELFGHEKGSFTGAHARKIGKLEAAAGGTLFLDEIGDMPIPLQAKILRFLQERTFERVGSSTSIQADVRVVSATHRDLQTMISEGTFREDLFYRLSEIDVTLPPLRERGADVLLIAEKILEEHGENRSLKFKADAVDAMANASWPGNVRELENRIRRAAILTDSNEISSTDLEFATDESLEDVEIEPLKVVRARSESKAIQTALAKTGHNLSESARLLEVSRPTLYSLIDKYGLESSE